MADLIVVTVIEVVIEVTVSVVLHLAVRDVLDGPDLEIGVSLPIRVVEGLTQGVEVGRPGRQFETVCRDLKDRDTGDTWAGSIQRRREAWRRARRGLHPRWILPRRRCAGRSSSRD